MKTLTRLLAAGAIIALLPSLGWSQASTDHSEMEQWVKDSANQGDLPVGTKVTIANWQQHKNFLPLGLQKMFEGKYFWKMPDGVELEVGPAKHDFVPKFWKERTEQYGGQTSVEVLPNGHYVLHNYHGGTPFPNPQEPNKGWKILANSFFAWQPVVIFTPDRIGTIWANDRYGNVNATTIDAVYRFSAYQLDPNFPETSTYAPGTWFTEWLMEEQPEQARYTASLNLFYIDQEKVPFPDTYVFVPALRRSLRLASTARCSPVFGFDWSYDDAKTNGFNGSTSIYTGDFLGDRKILTLSHYDQAASGKFPDQYLMPLGFPKPSWGKWEVRDHAINDVHRIPSEASGYCYSSRIMYVDREHWDANWIDLYDSNHKLWKSISYYNHGGDNVPGLGSSWDGIASAAVDFQNQHETIWSGTAGKDGAWGYLGINSPKEYLDGVKYGSPGGLMTIMR